MGLLSEGKVHRLLIKPPALGITRLLIESAVNRCLRLSDAATTEWPPARRAGSDASWAGVTGQLLPVWLLASAAAALVVGVAIVAGVTAAWRPEVASSSAGTDASGDALGASRATAADVAPQREAVDAYLAMVRDDAANATSRQPSEPIVSALLAQAEEALLADDLRGAEAALSELRQRGSRQQ